MANRAKRGLIYAVAAFICLFCVAMLSACNTQNDAPKISEREYSLYFSDIQYNSDELTMSVIVALKGDEENKLNEALKWKSTSFKENVLFNGEDVLMSVNPKALFDEIDGLLTDGQREHDGVKYNRLKVALRYDTIYKSIKSDADVAKNGRYYVHTFAMDEAESIAEFSLHLKTQNSANWYTLLIAVVLICAVVLIAVMLAIKGKLWQKKRK